MDFTIKGGREGARIAIEEQREQDGILYFDVHMEQEEAIPEPFTVSIRVPVVETYSIWSPAVRWDRSLGPDWNKRRTMSRLASWMPLHAAVSATGRNRMTVALSDAVTPTSIGTGVCEEEATLVWDITFFTVKVAPLTEYRAMVRIDQRDLPYYDSLYDAVQWWEKECGYEPAAVPDAARLPMNSLWYSYHQRLDPEEILKECVLSKEIGLETVIVDDGWQTDDNNRGYAFCGDWNLATSKIPDMRAFVDQVHATGMKIMLWYSVAHIGMYSESYRRFSDKLLDETGNTKTYWAIDPRYPDCRAYLIEKYAKAVKEWDLDGLKLDFIDSFALKGKSLAYDERRDFQSLEDAVDALMTGVLAALKAIKPDILVEFRQSYVGPAMRRYGNMLRVGDCPNDAILNRYDSVNLRFTSGSTAVHSDMLMWHRDDPVECAALQFASSLFTVPQISVKLATLPEDHRRMLAHYLAFWREHREILLDGKLRASHPESGYGLVWAEKDGRAVFVSYTDSVIDCTGLGESIAVNATAREWLILKGAANRRYRVVSCLGEELSRGTVEGALAEIAVPLSGMVIVE